MESIKKLKNYIDNLEERDFYIYLSIFFFIILLVLILLIFWHKSRVNYWQSQFNELKKYRNVTQNLIKENSMVELDRQKVNDILSSGVQSFKIRGYYDDLVNQLSLTPFKAKDPAEPETIQLESGEKERILTAEFHELNMKQVTDILKHIEDNPRVYAKKINIDKSGNRPTVNIIIEIATIEPPVQNG